MPVLRTSVTVPPSLAPQVSFALSTMPSLARIAEDVRTSPPIRHVHKDEHPLSVVTTADMAVDASFIESLSQTFPRDTVISEESSQTFMQDPGMAEDATRFLQRMHPAINVPRVVELVRRGETQKLAERTWVIDPIDKTHAFVSGAGVYAINLAYFHHGTLAMSVIAYPNLKGITGYPQFDAGVMVLSIKDHGAWYMPLDTDPALSLAAPLRVSQHDQLKTARFMRPDKLIDPEMPDHEKAVFAELTKALPDERHHLVMGHLDRYLYLASGAGDLFLTPAFWSKSIWDHAAPMLMVQEAGGVITDFSGNPIDWGVGHMLAARGIVLTNGVLHPSILGVIAAAVAGGGPR